MKWKSRVGGGGSDNRKVTRMKYSHLNMKTGLLTQGVP